MKIIGFSDVITNSSSEIFTIYTKEGVEQIKDIVNAVLKAGESNFTFDDLFEIKLSFDEDWAKDEYQEIYPDVNIESVSEEDLLECALRHDEEEYEGSNIVDGIIITAKDPKNKDHARILDSIDYIFRSEERYC